MTERLNQIDIPVRMVIRVSRRDSEPFERAKLVAIDDRGREHEFIWEDEHGNDRNLTVVSGDASPTKQNE